MKLEDTECSSKQDAIYWKTAKQQAKQKAAFDRDKTKRNYKYKNTEVERDERRKRLKGNLNVRNRPLREKKEEKPQAHCAHTDPRPPSPLLC